jgi:hypothetical protein
MDVQGAEKARPWVEKAQATSVTLVDASNELGGMFGFNYVPLTILIDENGKVVRGPQGTDIDRESDRQTITQWIEAGSLPVQPAAASLTGFSAPDTELRFQAATLILALGDQAAAVALFRKALTYDPENWIIRKQIWAVENPGRFYSGPIDWDWQKRQLEEEKLPSK